MSRRKKQAASPKKSSNNNSIGLALKGMVILSKKEVPIWEKATLTLEEAAAYSGIGICKLRELSNEKDCPFVLFNGNKRLIKRKQLDEYLEHMYSI